MKTFFTNYTGKALFTLIIVCLFQNASAQLSLTNGSPSATIDFSNSMQTGVGTNASTAYTAAGFEPSPTTAGRLNSNAWAVTGWTDGALAFGGTRITAATDYTRGAVSAAVATGGFYAYTGSPGSASNPTFMIQPGGSDFAPGTLVLRIQNNGTTNITQLALSYNIYVRNDQTRSSSFNFSHSPDNTTYTNVAGLDYTSGAAVDALGWVLVGSAPSRSTTITGLNITPGSYYYVRWSSADVAGTGSRDEFGLDDIAVTATYSGGGTTVSLSASSNTGTEAASSVITLTATATAAVTANETVDITITGTNITAGDYTLSNAQITILNGQTTGSVTFTVTNDALVEGTETAIATISNPSAGMTLGSPVSQNIVITDDDLPTVSLSVDAATGTEAAGTVITATATASQAVTGNQTVNIAASGTNITASDYSLSGTTITILSGQTTGSVTFTILNDVLRENTETATLTISSPSSGISLGTPTTQNVSITDNDDAIPLTALNTPSTTSTFDELANTGTSNDGSTNMPRGAYMLEQGSNANTNYRAESGTSGTGDTYSWGATSATDRAFGSLTSGSLVPAYMGVKFLNNTGTTVNALIVNYWGEQWRDGDNTLTGTNRDKLAVESSKNATTLSNGSWTAAPQLDFYAPVTTSSTGTSLSGNAAANRVQIIDTLVLGNVADGANFWVRWKDADVAGSDDGMGIEDAIFTAVYYTPTTYYSTATGNLDVLTTWGSNTDGTGINPTAFNASNTTYIITNRTTATIGADWTVSGTGSKVLVTTDVTFTVPQANAFVGTVDLDSAATIILKHATVPTFGSIDLNSTVIYGSVSPDVQNVAGSVTYGNLTFNSTGTKKIVGGFRVANELLFGNGIMDADNSNFWVLFFQRDLNVTPGVYFTPDFATQVNLQAYGAFHQVIQTNGDTLQAGRLLMNVNNTGGTLITSGTDLKTDTLEIATNSKLELSDDIKLNMTATSYFADNGTTIKVGGDVEAAGTTANYLLTGTIELTNSTTNGTSFIRQDGAGGNALVIKAHLNNLVVNTGANVNTEFRPSTGSATITIKGDLTFSGTSTGAIKLFGNTYALSGNYTDFTVGTVSHNTSVVLFEGDVSFQSFTSTSNDSLYKVTINNAYGVSQSGDFHVANTFTGTNGVWNTNADKIVLGAAATIVENDSSYVNGLVETTRTLAQNVNHTFGGLGIEINATGGTPGSTLVKRTTGISIPLGCYVSVNRQFEVIPTTNTGLNATVKFTYLEGPELNGLDENFLKIFQYIGAGPWSVVTSTSTPATNSVTATGVNTFGKLTLANPQPSGGTAYANTAANPNTVVCSGSNVTITLAGSLGNIQWQKSVDAGVTWTEISGATNTTYTEIGMSGNTCYRAIVTNPCYSISSNTVDVKISATPVITFTNLTSTSVAVSWTPFAATKYNISWSGAGTGSANAVTSIPYVITGLTPNTNLSVTVTKVAPACTGTNPGTATTKTLCAIPTNIVTVPVTTPTNQQGLKVTWTAVAGATDYRVYYRAITMNANWSIVDTTGTTKTIKPLYAGVPYAIMVAAYNCPTAGQLGEASAIQYFTYTNPAPVACGPIPTVTAVSNCPNQITVNITGGSNWRLSLRRISPSYTAGVSYNTSSATTNFNVGQAAVGTVWEVFAQSNCSGVYSQISNVVTVNVKNMCPPLQNLVLSNVVCNGFAATWNADNCMGLGVTGYYLYIKKQSSAAYTAYSVGPNNNKTMNTLLASTIYNVYVASQTCNGSISSPSAIQTVTLPACREENIVDETTEQNQTIIEDGQVGINIFPNPTSGAFNVLISGSAGESLISVELVDALGKVLSNSVALETNGSTQLQIQMPDNAAAGMYFVRTIVNGKPYTSHVMYTK